nr:hypothetical protein [Tanacetum cinerariifolium]
MLIQHPAEVGKGSRQPTKPQHKHTTTLPSHIKLIPIVPSLSQPKKTHTHRRTKRKATEISQSCGTIILVTYETVHEVRGDRVERDATTCKIVPSWYVIFDLEPLSFSFNFVFTFEMFKSLFFSLDHLYHLVILCLGTNTVMLCIILEAY